MPGPSGPAGQSLRCRACRGAARLGGIARVDVHRPAAWLAAGGAAGGAAVACAADSVGSLPPAAAIVVGGLTAVAAIGAPPRISRRGGRPEPAWWVARAAWPAAGICVAAVICGRPLVAMAGAAAVIAAAALSHAAAATGAAAALAASTALVPILAGAAGLRAGGAAGAAIAGVPMAALVLAIGLRWTRAEPEDGPPPGADAEPAASRAPLLTMALVSSLATMSLCYFLDPRYAAWYAALAAAWLVGLAVPEATLATGTADGPARRRLVRSGPLGMRAALAEWRSGLGDARRGGLLVARQAALLGWPAVVAAVLWGGAAARPGGPLTAVAVLAVLAALIVVVGCGLGATGARRETALAATLVAAVFAMLAIVRSLPGLPGSSPPVVPAAGFVPVSVLSGPEIPARLPRRRSRLRRVPGDGRVRDAAPIESRNGVA